MHSLDGVIKGRGHPTMLVTKTGEYADWISIQDDWWLAGRLSEMVHEANHGFSKDAARFVSCGGRVLGSDAKADKPGLSIWQYGHLHY